MFKKIQTELEKDHKISGDKLYDYLDELQNSKVFRNSQIEIVTKIPVSIKITTKRIDKWCRFKGKIYLYSISLVHSYSAWNGPPPFQGVFYIRGNFDEAEFIETQEKCIDFDRVSIINQLDI